MEKMPYNDKNEWKNSIFSLFRVKLHELFLECRIPLRVVYNIVFFKISTVPELNLKTYEQWLSIAQTLKIQSHVICTMSIKGSVVEAWKSYFDDPSRAQTWSLYPLNSGLLKDIKKCIKRMEGLDGLYYGTAALYFVVNHTPQGADQVAAAQECFASAQAWEERSERLDESEERMIAVSLMSAMKISINISFSCLHSFVSTKIQPLYYS